MPDYTARIRFAAPELDRGEFRRLRTQLAASLRDEDTASEVAHQTRSRTVEATLAITAGSSTRAQAIAEASGRRLLQRVRFVRLSRVQLSAHLRLRTQQPRSDAGDANPATSGDSPLTSLVSDT